MLDLGKTFLQSAERSPHALAVIDGDVRWTYGQWALRIGALQRTLAQGGDIHDQLAHIDGRARRCGAAGLAPNPMHDVPGAARVALDFFRPNIWMLGAGLLTRPSVVQRSGRVPSVGRTCGAGDRGVRAAHGWRRGGVRRARAAGCNGSSV